MYIGEDYASYQNQVTTRAGAHSPANPLLVGPLSTSIKCSAKIVKTDVELWFHFLCARYVATYITVITAALFGLFAMLFGFWLFCSTPAN